MITNCEDGVRQVVLGEGTTYISQILVDDCKASSGILFSNKVPLNNKFQGDEVIIEIINLQGALSYMSAIVDLLKTWEIEGLDSKFEALSETLSILQKK